MKTVSDILELLKPALDEGCMFEIYLDQDKTFCINLNTEAKSECVLKIEEDGLKAYTRYNGVNYVSSFEDVLEIVEDCACGRSYFSEYWLKVLKSHGMVDPRGTL